MNEKMPYIMPECYVDTNLVEFLLGAAVGHQHSCTKVIGNMKGCFKDSFAVGVIDNEKVKMGYLSECEEVARQAHLVLYRHRKKHHYIITVSPAIDVFVLSCAKDLAVAVTNYNLPVKLKDVIKDTKQITSNKDLRFKALFAAIMGHPEIQALQRSLMYLNDYKYQSDTRELAAIFTNLESSI